ncbi:MAG: HEAT repeat domain-containing protein [Phycisphaerales bacterium]|nr:MAG: HEAT repeat domain-containing protein [Phycisphaerales bacterium]
MLIRRLVPLPILLLVVLSCAPPATDGGFDSPNPAAKLYAMEQAVRAGDESAAARIVEQLDSDDPAVRMMAIESLRRLTGTTLGYDHSAASADRREAIGRWVQAVESGSMGTTGQEGAPDG